MVLEVMGRYAGWIALHGGLAGGADAILIPEIPFSYDVLCDFVKEEEARSESTLIVVGEGACAAGADYAVLAGEAASPSVGEKRLGGIGSQVAEVISKRTSRETRTVVLGHLQRGGNPTTLDRILGTRFGVGAVRLIEEKKFGQMVSYQNYLVGAVSIKEAVGQLKRVPTNGQMVATARAVGINFGN
jgi:6-phosphofructokinase 1